MSAQDLYADQWVKADSPAVWKVNAVSAASIKPVAIRWLWPGWLAKGKLHILAGAGGTGKTTLLISLIATITTGGRWPDGSRCSEPGNALIWSSEDDPADTLVPRLAAAGADLNRVHIIQGRINAQGEADPFDPANDIALLRATANEIGGVSLLMLDPIVSAVKGDMHKANDVRRALQGVVDFAEQNLCAVVGISHFAKGGAGSSPADRVIGSQAFSALARTVLVAAKQEGTDMRVLARAKSNIGTDEGGVSYTIEPCDIGGGIEAKGAWSSHDLRKVARTAWADLGVDYMVGEMLLNHAMKDLDATYIHTTAEGMKRKALETWHQHLDRHGFDALHGGTYPGQAADPSPAQTTNNGACSDSPHPSQGRMQNDSARTGQPPALWGQFTQWTAD